MYVYIWGFVLCFSTHYGIDSIVGLVVLRYLDSPRSIEQSQSLILCKPVQCMEPSPSSSSSLLP